MTADQLSTELVRLQEVAAALEERTDDLNDLINALSDKLVASGVGVTAWIESQVMSGWKFGFCKVSNQWQLAAVKGSGGPMPLTGAPRKLRLAAMGRADELVRALADKSEKFLGDIEEATRITEDSMKEEE